VCIMNIARRPSWLRVAGVSLAIFLTVLAVLWFRVSAGADPVLSAHTSSGQVTTPTGSTATSSDDTTSSDDATSSSSTDIPITSAS
jgi:hypothetical protein